MAERGEVREAAFGGQKYYVSVILTAVIQSDTFLVCQTVLERDPAAQLFMPCFVKLSSAFYVIEMYHLYVFGCQSVRQQQTGFVFCCVRLELQVSGCAFDLLAFFFEFIWLNAFVCDPHYNLEIKYTSKQLKLNKIKCAARHRRYMLIEHIYICLLISHYTTNFPLFIYLNVLSYSY